MNQKNSSTNANAKLSSTALQNQKELTTVQELTLLAALELTRRWKPNMVCIVVGEIRRKLNTRNPEAAVFLRDLTIFLDTIESLKNELSDLQIIVEP
jgi:hypothetical protein